MMMAWAGRGEEKGCRLIVPHSLSLSLSVRPAALKCKQNYSDCHHHRPASSYQQYHQPLLPTVIIFSIILPPFLLLMPSIYIPSILLPPIIIAYFRLWPLQSHERKDDCNRRVAVPHHQQSLLEMM